jgi:TIR domain-containing protein
VANRGLQRRRGRSRIVKIFIAYASEDKRAADAISLSLRNRGHRVFFDRDDLPAGTSYDQRIEHAIQDTDIFLFLISPDSVAEGRYSLTELRFAREKWLDPTGCVLPVLVRNTPRDQIPSYLNAVTILEPQGNTAAETSAAVEKMRRNVPRALKAEPPWAFLRESRNRKVLIGIGGGAAIAACLWAWQPRKIDLTGTWSGVNVGGTYKIMQTGEQITWEGASPDAGKYWAHTFNGDIHDNLIVGRFVDHPPGIQRNSGNLTIQIINANRLVMFNSGSSGFAETIWVRTGPGQP